MIPLPTCIDGACARCGWRLAGSCFFVFYWCLLLVCCCLLVGCCKLCDYSCLLLAYSLLTSRENISAVCCELLVVCYFLLVVALFFLFFLVRCLFLALCSLVLHTIPQQDSFPIPASILITFSYQWVPLFQSLDFKPYAWLAQNDWVQGAHGFGL